MYAPKYIRLEKNTYEHCVNVARSYYSRLQRRREIEDDIINAGRNPPDGMPKGGTAQDETAEKALRLIQRKAANDEKLLAIEDAWHSAARDTAESDFIRLNMFSGIKIRDINLPMPEITMKRIRKRFLVKLAENLREI